MSVSSVGNRLSASADRFSTGDTEKLAKALGRGCEYDVAQKICAALGTDADFMVKGLTVETHVACLIGDVRCALSGVIHQLGFSESPVIHRMKVSLACNAQKAIIRAAKPLAEFIVELSERPHMRECATKIFLSSARFSAFVGGVSAVALHLFLCRF